MTPPHLALLNDLTQWYAKSARVLPWRQVQHQRDPYRVLVSEIMLQQTTVATVKVRYGEFLQRFPTTKVLSAAPIDDVLAQWQGLGYYNRARNLQAAARAIEEQHGGIFPRDIEKVLSLPGVGRYTAGAICSLAFEQAAPILDVNVARVLSRLFVVEEDTKSAIAQQRLWTLAAQMVENAAQHDIAPSLCNSALIELGALVCTKRIPLCTQCPVQRHCGAFAAKLQHQLPRTPPPRQFVQRHDVCLFITQQENNLTKVLLQRCGDGENASQKSGNWWRGMWQLPRQMVGENQTASDAARQLLHDELGFCGEIGQPLKTLRHTVTHHKIQLDCFAATATAPSDSYQKDNTLKSTFSWHTRQEIETLALPSVMRKLIDSLLARDEGGLLKLME